MHRYLIKNKKTPWFGVISVMSALFGTGFSFVMSHLLDLAHDSSDNELVFFIFFSIAYVFITVAAEFLFSFIKYSIIRDAMVNVKNDIFKSVLSKSISEYDKHGTGYFLNELNTKSDMLSELYFKNLMSLPYYGISFASAVIASIYLNWIMLVIMVVFGVLTVYITNKTGSRIGDTAKALSDTLPVYTQKTKDFLEGYRTIKVFGAEKRVWLKHSEINGRLENSRFDKDKSIMMVNYSGELIGLISTVAVTGIAAILALNNHITIGAVLAFSQLMGKIVSPIACFVDMRAQLESAKPVITELTDTLKKKDLNENYDTDSIIPSVRFEHVSFAYPEAQEKALKDCSLEITGNHKVLITGKSGCGKSTLFSLLMKFYEDYTGKIYVGDKSISELPAGFIYSKIAYLSQMPFVFEDTIRNNICLFDETISDEDLRIVTQKADLTKFIESLPDGIDTPLSELGGNISGGERQRICLARTLLFDKDIILLDEFENNLDAETRCLVENSILAMDDKLVIAASHDVSDDHKRKYDIIYTVDDKNVALQG